jgi:Domain of unknown function (DUF5134)
VIQPTWLANTLAGLMIATSAYCVVRLVAARVWKRVLHRDTNLAHAADGVAMSGMLVGSFRTLPTGVWEVIFAAFTVWCATRGARFVARHGLGSSGGAHADHLSHYLSHLVMAGAMLYMFLEGSSSATGGHSVMSAMGGGGASDLAVLTLLLAVLLFWSAVWHADALTRYTSVRPALAGVGATGVGGTGVGAPSPAAWPAPGGGGDAQKVTAGAGGDDDDQSRSLAPRLEMACHIALCITMGYMLVLLL